MRKLFAKILIITAVSGVLIVPNVHANVNAIDFSKVPYPGSLEDKIDFLRSNDGIYNHWVHDWTAKIPKDKVVSNLTSLYTGLDKLQGKNAETELLLGDIAHYLYNMEIEEYYQKAVDHYKAAQVLTPQDYRVYWFLANHYSLSATQIIAMQTYAEAMKHLPQKVHEMFWADYSVACANASMFGTAYYAAHQSSLIAGKRSYVENEITGVMKSMLRTPPPDTTIKTDDLWGASHTGGVGISVSSYVLGTKMTIDSTWGMRFNDLQDRKTYVMIKPHEGTAKDGQKIGYNLLVFIKKPADGETFDQFMELFTGKYQGKKPTSFSVGKLQSSVAYEIKDPKVYPEVGGAHFYMLGLERDDPEYPGMQLDMPLESPKANNGQVNYFRARQKYTRLKGKLYYFIMMDTCEAIHDESLATFKDFLDKLIIE